MLFPSWWPFPPHLVRTITCNPCLDPQSSAWQHPTRYPNLGAPAGACRWSGGAEAREPVESGLSLKSMSFRRLTGCFLRADSRSGPCKEQNPCIAPQPCSDPGHTPHTTLPLNQPTATILRLGNPRTVCRFSIFCHLPCFPFLLQISTWQLDSSKMLWGGE